MEENQQKEQGLPIPKIFLDSDSGAPLQRCIDCDYKVFEGDRYYMIEKVVKRYPELDTTEVLFEYAICQNCYEKMKDAMSEESMANLSSYMMQNTDFEGLSQRIEEQPDNPEYWLSNCLIKGTPVKEMNEYQMGACFKGDRLMTDFIPPFMIGELAMDEMNELLSQATKDEMDDFMGDHFGIPPELRKDLILI